MSANDFPPGWDDERVRRVLEHYENQTDEQSVAEDEDRFANPSHVVMEVPADLAAEIRQLIAKRQSG